MPSSRRPPASVVIATYNRKALLAELLERLSVQTIAPEVIICDDGSTDGSETLAHQPVVSRYLYHEHAGYHRVARYNEGVAEAAGHFVILLDDDMLPVSNYFVEAHLQALVRGHAVLGLGVNERGEPAPPPWFSTANVSLVTQLAKRLGPFDPYYDGRYGYEDHDLGKTLEAGGWTVITGDSYTTAQHRGIPYDGGKSGMQANRDYYCRKWGIPNV